MKKKILSTSTLIQPWPLMPGDQNNPMPEQMAKLNVLNHILVISLTILLKILLVSFLSAKTYFLYLKILFRFRGW